jgi:cytochrome P450
VTNAPVTDDMLSAAAVRDPYAYFGRLRETAPVHFNERYRMWLLTRYADVEAAFRDPRFSSDRITPFIEQRLSDQPETGLARTFNILADWLVFKDPPDHGRLRKLVSRAFTPRAVEQMQERIELIASQLLDALPTDGTVDLIRGFAYPLPAIVIAEMLGVPPSDRDLFKGWSDDISALVFGGLDEVGRHDRAAVGMLELASYLTELIDHYETEPADNLISALVRAEGEGDKLSRDEVVATCTLLLFGGHETTTNLIGNGLLALLQHPDQLDHLRVEPQDFRPAVEEFLRFDGPAKAVARVMAEDVVIGEQHLRRGDRVYLVPAAANRDPRVYDDPDVFDIRREGPQHLGFAFGPHYCLGAPLARMEGTVAIRAVLDRFDGLELATDELSWHPVMLNRGLMELPVALRRREGTL